MIIERIMAQNFLSHTNSTVDLTEAPLWLVSGANGSGKSALFDAVEFALYGEHRGGGQQTNLLVKQGQRRAKVQVIIGLDGERYRVTQHLDYKTGNRGGILEQWEPAAGQWKAKNVGTGVNAVWSWLTLRLPPHELFKSAIFLRQGDSQFFLRGSANDRMKRFAALVDLSRYTELSRRAKKRSEKAEGEARQTQGRREALGDVSDDALAAANENMRQAAKSYDLAAAELARTGEILKGAEDWQRLLTQRDKLESERQECEVLLANEISIRADASRVAGWDRVKADIERYWGERARTVKRLEDADKDDAEVRRIDEQLGEMAQATGQLTIRKDAIEGEELPCSRQLSIDAATYATALELENRIAGAREALTVAELDVERLSRYDHDVDGWQGRSTAIILVDALMTRDNELAAARTAFEKATQDACNADDVVHVDEEAARQTEEAYIKIQAEIVETQALVAQLREGIAGLNGQILGHRHLEGAETECPVCLQPLDEAAHKRVQQSLADKVATISAWEAELVVLDTSVARLQEEKAGAEKAKRGADRKLQTSLTLATSAHQDVERATTAVQLAMTARERAYNAVVTHSSTYISQLDGVTEEWVAEEKVNIEQKLVCARKNAQDLTSAREASTHAMATLTVLCGQRADGAEDLGDQLAVEDLEKLWAEAVSTNNSRKATVIALEEELGDLNQRIESLINERIGLTSERAAATTAHATAVEDAHAAQRAADAISTALSSEWKDALASEEGFEGARRDINSRRVQAARVPEVDQARGRLGLIRTQLADVMGAMTSISSEHRIPVEVADESVRAARSSEHDAAVVKERCDLALKWLHDARQKAKECDEQIAAATEQATTFAELSDILRESGPLQTEVANREQQRIATEVNALLEQLADPLRIGIGPTQRASQSGVTDLHVIDTSDPLGQPRYFKYLSGGEQFRIATTLALALHRRVGRDAGTIIIDEGFGALDNNRRDAFAAQLTDTSCGILNLGLARSIIICSHSSEVQSRFADQWEVTKESGSASVCRKHFAGSGEEGV